MKKTLTLLAATTALSVAIGVPAWSTIRAADDGAGSPLAAIVQAGQDARPIILARGDDDDDHKSHNGSHYEDDDGDDDDHRHGHRHGAGHDDDDDDDCDGHRDDDECTGSARNAAPAGSVAPPKNGLFGNGAAPTARVN